MYVGPDMLMPLASALAAVTGVVLMFWRRLISVLRFGLTRITRIFGQH